MSTIDSAYQVVEDDIWTWIHDFVTAPSEFYNFKFAPCPYARQAVQNKTGGRPGLADRATFASSYASKPLQMREASHVDDPRDGLSAEDAFSCGGSTTTSKSSTWSWFRRNVFLNTGVAKTTKSRFPGSASKDPYFIVIANSLAAVLVGAESLAKSNYYENWPAAHYAHVVERRARLAKKYGNE